MVGDGGAEAQQGGGGGGRKRRRAHLRKKKRDDEDNNTEDAGAEVNLDALAAAEGGRSAAEKGKQGGPNSFATAKPAEWTVGLQFQFASSGTAQRTTSDNGATRMLETETEADRDGRALREKLLKTSTSAGEEGSGADDGKTYKGLLGYNDYKSGFRQEQNTSNMRKTGAFGPLRASTAIRANFRLDYQPDICKDYKETGYCGYGDSCKFLHDRVDYKSGWQLEKEWEQKEKLRKEQAAAEAMLGEKGDAKEEEDDGLPFACHICRLPFKSPVVTRCKHYFCEHCALKEHAKTGKCAICKQATNGTFNIAHALKAKMRRIDERNKCVAVTT